MVKRFYKAAAATAGDGGWSVTLDGKGLKTPAGRPLVLPSRALAEGVAAEWQAQGDEVRPISMPLMRLAATALDRVADNRPAVIDEVVNYAGTDLLCYRAPQPQDLVQRQTASWQPILDWLQLTFDATLEVTTALVPRPQPEQALRALRRAIEGYDDLRLAALFDATAICGSCALGLAMVERRLDSHAAFEAAFLDELHQATLWGEDPEATARRSSLRGELAATEVFLHLLAG